MLALHLSEIEEEADKALDLLMSIRSLARRGEAEAEQEGLAELTISLEHLLHHTQLALPMLQNELDLSPELLAGE